MSQTQLFLELGGDFVLNSNGGLLATSDSWTVIRQNLERFIFTCSASIDRFGNPQPADWVFHPDFGLSANAMIGQVFDQAFLTNLQQKVYQGALAAQSGNATVPPQVTVTQGPNPQQINVTVVITPLGGQQQTIQVTLP